jgi:hypothetical protein
MHLQHMSLSESSHRTYLQGKSAYLSFCAEHALSPFPALESNLCLFVSYLARNVSYATTRTYIAAVRYWNIKLGFPTKFENMTYLRMTVRGTKRVNGLTKREKKLPITIDIMKQLKNQLRISSFTERDKLMLWCAFTTAFFGFLRSSEFCCPTSLTFDPSSCLLVRDANVSPTSATIMIKVSKTDPFHNGNLIRFVPSGSSICPVKALNKHIPSCKHTEMPLFTFEDNSFLTRQKLTETLQQLLHTKHDNEKLYTSHSFRIGAATTAAAANVPSWLIKRLGRWSSNCFERYIRPSTTESDCIPNILSRSRVISEQ